MWCIPSKVVFATSEMQVIQPTGWREHSISGIDEAEHTVDLLETSKNTSTCLLRGDRANFLFALFVRWWRVVLRSLSTKMALKRITKVWDDRALRVLLCIEFCVT